MFRALAQGIMPESYNLSSLSLAAAKRAKKDTMYTNLGEQTRNHANRDHILWSVQLKPGEFSRSSRVQHSDSVSFWMPRLILTQGEKTRNRDSRDRILLPVPFKLGELHYTC